MRYKLPLKYKLLSCVYEDATLDVISGVVKTQILSIEKFSSLKFGGYVFDITVKDNENYFAQNTLVHNCSATYFCVRNPHGGIFRSKWLFGVCSRNFQLLKPDKSSYWTIAKNLLLEAKMKTWCQEHDCGLIIQGEAVGTGIQGNKYNKKDIQFYVFNVIEYHKGKTYYYDQLQQTLFCVNFGNLNTVPVLHPSTYLLPTIPEMVELSKGKSKESDIPREGVVVRNYESNVSFKVVSPDFLLKYGE